MDKKNRGDRIVQIILLLLIAAGLAAMIWLNLGGGKSPAPGGKAMGGRPASSTGRPAPSPSDGQRGTEKESGRGWSGSPSSATAAIAVETVELIRKDVNQYIRVNGDVTVETSVELFSDTNGKLVSRRISLGDSIAKDQLIALVDPSLPGQNYSVSSVRSTISGTVISLPLQVGDKVTTQTPLATIGDLNDLFILTYIPERFVSNLKTGLIAQVSFDAFPGETFSAGVMEINPVMDVNTRTLSVKLELNKRDSRIRPGMFASMKLITKESRDTLAVPTRAVLSYYGEDAVYIIDENGQARRQIVRTGLVSDEETEIIEGLNEGDRVITQGMSKLTEGTPVRSVEVNL